MKRRRKITMKVGVIYTAKTDALEKCINKSLCEKLGAETEIVNYQDLTVLLLTQYSQAWRLPFHIKLQILRQPVPE